MTPEQAKMKYGKKMYKKMLRSKELDGITICLNEKGEIDIPERDLQRAYDLMTEGKSNIEWD